MLHHFAAREEELFKIGAISLNTLRPSSIKVSKVGLRMSPLSRSDPLLSEFQHFMLDVLEVVNSPAESPKFTTSASALDFLHIGSLMPSSPPFSMLQNILDLQIFKCNSCPVSVLKTVEIE
jgi:hypothetical protein